ncbi:MAG: hypothetical protein AB1782_10725 [Cyanobacteriota bacterium]
MKNRLLLLILLFGIFILHSSQYSFVLVKNNMYYYQINGNMELSHDKVEYGKNITFSIYHEDINTIFPENPSSELTEYRKEFRLGFYCRVEDNQCINDKNDMYSELLQGNVTRLYFSYPTIDKTENDPTFTQFILISYLEYYDEDFEMYIPINKIEPGKINTTFFIVVLYSPYSSVWTKIAYAFFSEIIEILPNKTESESINYSLTKNIFVETKVMVLGFITLFVVRKKK